MTPTEKSQNYSEIECPICHSIEAIAAFFDGERNMYHCGICNHEFQLDFLALAKEEQERGESKIDHNINP